MSELKTPSKISAPEVESKELKISSHAPSSEDLARTSEMESKQETAEPIEDVEVAKPHEADIPMWRLLVIVGGQVPPFLASIVKQS